MNCEPVIAGNQTNDDAGIEINVNEGQARQEKASDHEYIPLPFMPSNSPLSLSTQSSDDKDTNEVAGKEDKGVSIESKIDDQERFDSKNQDVNTIGLCINNANTNINIGSLNINIVGSNDLSPSWIEVMQEELLQFKLQKVWTLVDLPNGKRAIRSKWDFRNNKDKRGIIVRNKARLVVQGYTQKEGIDYDKVFALVARIEEIKLFLAYASFIRFIVYQMEVKSALLRGIIDKTLFIKKDKGDILLVQVYVDDIIFGSTKKFLCDDFKQIMHKRLQMSSMGEPTFFLGLQVKQKDDGIFISQDKNVADILKKFDFTTIRQQAL
nr:putative ribonuclease H-like domain-containing protein [Tanacetum cinerariifolium]